LPLFKLDAWPGTTVTAKLDDLAKIYTEVYAEPPYSSGPLWSAESFVARTRRQTTRNGFTFIGAHAGQELVGFAFGLTFDEGTWWSGDPTPPPEEILEASKFAVIELVVIRQRRGQGVGRQLLNRLLAERPERYAILTAMPDAPAREMYGRWGWHQTGTAHHTPDSPVLDALVFRLHEVSPR
jgi:GNAT superfamily N-acetyltransferase